MLEYWVFKPKRNTIVSMFSVEKVVQRVWLKNDATSVQNAQIRSNFHNRKLLNKTTFNTRAVTSVWLPGGQDKMISSTFPLIFQ